MKGFKTDREFLEEIGAWLSFNCHPSKEQIGELKENLRNYLLTETNKDMPKIIVIWVTYDEYGDIETEFIYPEIEENKKPYQLEKYLLDNKNKTAKRLNCFAK